MTEARAGVETRKDQVQHGRRVHTERGPKGRAVVFLVNLSRASLRENKKPHSQECSGQTSLDSLDYEDLIRPAMKQKDGDTH